LRCHSGAQEYSGCHASTKINDAYKTEQEALITLEAAMLALK